MYPDSPPATTWTISGPSQGLRSMGPSSGSQAMDLCWGGTGKGKLLLAASYLYAVNPPRPESVPKEAAGLLKSLFLRGGKEAAKEQAVDNPDPGLCWAGRSAREVSAWMQQALLQRVPALFAGSLSPAQDINGSICTGHLHGNPDIGEGCVQLLQYFWKQEGGNGNA